MTHDTPLILVTNDDGYQARGIHALVQALQGLGEMYVVAPADARSGASRSFTAMQPVRLHHLGDDSHGTHWTSCTGTPTDCVKLAYAVVLPRRPDLVVSGINLGDNASTSVHYSGTMGAAIEGAIKHTPSIGFSLASFAPDADFAPCLDMARQIAAQALANGMPADHCLNVNFPAIPHILGTRHCRAARGEWVEECMRANAPREGDWYWFTGRFIDLEPQATDTDMAALRECYASIVDIKV